MKIKLCSIASKLLLFTLVVSFILSFDFTVRADEYTGGDSESRTITLDPITIDTYNIVFSDPEVTKTTTTVYDSDYQTLLSNVTAPVNVITLHSADYRSTDTYEHGSGDEAHTHTADKYRHLVRVYIVSSNTFKNGSRNATYSSDYGFYYARIIDISSLTRNNGAISINAPNVNEVDVTVTSDDIESLKKVAELVDLTRDNYSDKGYEWSEDDLLDVPIIVKTFDSDRGDYITFSNAADGYYVEIEGRWYTVDDIEVYKENAVWKYKYHSIVKNSLSTWAKIDFDRLHTHSLGGINLRSTDTVYITDIGNDSFTDLLNKYPVDDRSYTGGTNSVGNYFSGYSDALTYFKTMYGVNMFGVFNSYELYARYVYIDDQGNISKSKWAHFYTGLAKESGSSGSRWDDSDNMDQEYNNDEGLTDDDKADLEEGGDSRSDPGATPKIDASKDWSDTISGLIDTSNQVFSLFKGLFGLMGSVPSMIASVFAFLPSWLIRFISIALALVVILRFVGR